MTIPLFLSTFPRKNLPGHEKLLKIAVFASGRGSNFEALHHALIERHINARIVVVISNNSAAGALSLARSFGIPAIHLSQKQFPDHTTFMRTLLDTLRQHGVDFIVLAGYMKRIDPELIAQFRQRIINIHPALLPKFGGPGMFGHHVHEAVIAAKEKESGATVHLVDEEYDHGKILLQERVHVEENDTPDSLAAKVLKIEHTILPRAIELITQGKLISSSL